VATSDPPRRSEGAPPPRPGDAAARLLVDTVEALAARAPAVMAAAALQLREIVLGLHFGDGSHAELRAEHSRLLAAPRRASAPTVEVYFDDRALNLLFDLERRPVDEVAAASLDVRGERDAVLAVWRTFQLLSQRASGLRAVQALWRAYRDATPERWGSAPVPNVAAEGPSPTALAPPRDTGWLALDYLDHRYPDDVDVAAGTVGGTVRTASRTLWDGRASDSWWAPPAGSDADLMDTLLSCKRRVREELLRMVPDREPRAELYDLIRDYPSREGKGLRPTLTLAACAALGGRGEDAVRTAAAIELFHNGFLVHDDIADESTHRRSLATLHEAHGVGLAVNTGDAMNLMAVDAVLSNLPTLGLARTLALIHEIVHMCRETVEGQAVELGWIRRAEVPARDEDYFHMSTKKTGWYTCISPCRLGAICAGETDPALLDRFNEVFRLVGIAFQIQDDVLNLVEEESDYGKEPLGDLLEGKRTVMMIHLFRECDAATRARMTEIIRLPRAAKTQEDARELLAAMHAVGSIEYAVALADRLAHEGVRRFESDLAPLPETEAKAVLRQIANYVTTRPL
jgi:geranylgeranyl diphosphate synthase type II